MKYSVQEMHQALKDGKCFWFYHIDNTFTLYKACLVGRDILVTWEGGQTRYTFSPNPKCLNYWICTKIEGEETMEKKTPHKHAELIKLWADTGCRIQYNVHALAIWIDCVRNNPSWDPDIEYRVKPTLVKKWKWVLTNKSGEGTFFELTPSYYANEEDWVKAVGTSNPWKLHQKIDSTMIEVEE